MAIIPTGHHVLVKPQKLEEVDSAYASAQRAGIQLLETEKRKEQIAVSKGTVIQIGPTAYKDYQDGVAWCAAGDLVAYARHGGMFIKDPETEEDFILLNDSDIVAILR
jgi:co-chaperonin GroES (HSP10)